MVHLQINQLDGITPAQWLVIGNKLGGVKNVTKILRGELDITVQPTNRTLVDRYGRCIPISGMSGKVCDPDPSFVKFRFGQPNFGKVKNYIRGIKNMQQHFDPDVNVSPRRFQEKTEYLLDLIKDNNRIANLTNGLWLPLIIPNLKFDDLGDNLNYFYKAAFSSYKSSGFGKNTSELLGQLKNEVQIASESRFDRLIEQSKTVEPLIGIYFPYALLGFSIRACRQQMQCLPEGLILSGLDTAVASIMYPEILWSEKLPSINLSGFSYQHSNRSLFFVATKNCLSFMITDFPWDYGELNSSGLLFIG